MDVPLQVTRNCYPKVFNCVGDWNQGGEDAEVDDRLDSLSRDDKESAFWRVNLQSWGSDPRGDRVDVWLKKRVIVAGYRSSMQ